jgi:hypothetical protein
VRTLLISFFLLNNKLWLRIRNTYWLENVQKPLMSSLDLIRLRAKLQSLRPDPLPVYINLLDNTYYARTRWTGVASR